MPVSSNTPDSAEQLETFEQQLDRAEAQEDPAVVSIGELVNEWTRLDQLLEPEERTQDMERAMEVLLRLSRLLERKATALDPSVVEEPEETLDDEGPGEEELLAHLETYEAFRQTASALAGRWDDGRAQIQRQGEPVLSEPEAPLPAVSLDQLVSALGRVIAEKESLEPAVIEPESVRLEERLEDLRQRLQQEAPLDFPELFRQSMGREAMIVTFLALLELIRLGEAVIRQEETLGPIEVRWRPGPVGLQGDEDHQ